MPSCLPAAASVRTRQNIQSATSACEVHIFRRRRRSCRRRATRASAGREVRAGFGLAVALAPADFAANDLRQVLAALLLGAELEQHGAEHPQAEALERLAAAERAQLLVEDGRFVGRQAAAAVLARPRRRRPAALGHARKPEPRVVVREHRLPPAPHPLLLAGKRRAHRGRAARREPRARLLSEIAHGRLRRSRADARSRSRRSALAETRSRPLPAPGRAPRPRSCPPARRRSCACPSRRGCRATRRRSARRALGEEQERRVDAGVAEDRARRDRCAPGDPSSARRGPPRRP